MSLSPDTKRTTRILRAQKSFKQVRVQQQKQSSQKDKLKSSNSKLFNTTKTSQSTNTIKAKTLSLQIEKHLLGAKQTKEKIFKGLQFVKLIDNFNQQQRCLQHNHVITLYCLNDKRLLCVYCIYGQNKHRSHKLLPPFQHIEYIAKDVYNMQNDFNDFLYSLEDVLQQSKQTTQVFKNIMKSYLSKLQGEYIKKKLQLEQFYSKQKNYIIDTCQSIISKSQEIYTEFQEIKFNIWECQARYHLDKRVKLPNMPLETQIELNKTSTIVMNKKDSKNLPKSPQKVKNKNQIDPIQTKPNKNQNPKHQLSTDSEKDMRQVMCKHVILTHIVQEMRHIEPLSIDQKTAQKKMFNKLELKLINQTGQLSPRNTPVNRKQSPNYFPKK